MRINGGQAQPKSLHRRQVPYRFAAKALYEPESSKTWRKMPIVAAKRNQVSVLNREAIGFDDRNNENILDTRVDSIDLQYTGGIVAEVPCRCGC